MISKLPLIAISLASLVLVSGAPEVNAQKQGKTKEQPAKTNTETTDKKKSVVPLNPNLEKGKELYKLKKYKEAKPYFEKGAAFLERRRN